jgi:hypothetical protein
MDSEPVPRWIILTTVFIGIGICCAGLILTGPSWVHLVPDFPARAARVTEAPRPTFTLIPTRTPTATPTPRPTQGRLVFPTIDPDEELATPVSGIVRNPAPIQNTAPIIRSEGGNPTGCLFFLLVLGGLGAVIIYFSRKPAKLKPGTTLEEASQWYLRNGFRIVQQTETTIQLTRPKRFDFIIASASFLICGIGVIFYIFYYLSQLDTTIYLQKVGSQVVVTRS